MKKKLLNYRGFTIIEVLIVLAIAGLILLIVFLAIPALQRNSRNTTTKNDASALSGGVSEYKSNNNGANPTAITGTGTITIGAAGTTTSQAVLQGGVTPISAAVATAANPIVYTIGTNCGGVAGPRNFAIHYWVEQAGGGVGTACVDA